MSSVGRPFLEIDDSDHLPVTIPDLDRSTASGNPYPTAFDLASGNSGRPRLWRSVWPCPLLHRAWVALENRLLCGSVCRPRRAATSLKLNTALRRISASDSLQRLKECFSDCQLCPERSRSTSARTIWFLGIRYVIHVEERIHVTDSDSYKDFETDFRSRIYFSYRKGFEAIGAAAITTDVGWGCMIRSAQMLVAQAMVCHHLGRAWRASPSLVSEHFESMVTLLHSRAYLEILQCFGDSYSLSCPFSIHNILVHGAPYGLKAGSWVGPYAISRALEAVARSEQPLRKAENQMPLFPFAIHVVSGDGGAPCIYMDSIVELCSRWGDEGSEQSACLLLIPLVLGLNEVNPRYLSSLAATFTFPQSVGIMGGKPGASTYLVGIEGDRVFYLDPHKAKQTCIVSPENPNMDTRSYHCSHIKQMLLSSIDPSLALGFYCRDREDFKEFCKRASKLEMEANGAPMFSVVRSNSNVSEPMNRDSTRFVQKDVALSDSNIGHRSLDEGWQIL